VDLFVEDKVLRTGGMTADRIFRTIRCYLDPEIKPSLIAIIFIKDMKYMVGGIL
jgi:hypothetical protein